jgi:hypothetical protein
VYTKLNILSLKEFLFKINYFNKFISKLFKKKYLKSFIFFNHILCRIQVC